MFEVGKFYSIQMLVQDGSKNGVVTTYRASKVIELNLPLVTFEDCPYSDEFSLTANSKNVTLNTTSTVFIGAVEKN